MKAVAWLYPEDTVLWRSSSFSGFYNLSAPSFMVFLSTVGRSVNTDVPFKAEYSPVIYSLYFDHLWLSLFFLTYQKKYIFFYYFFFTYYSIFLGAVFKKNEIDTKYRIFSWKGIFCQKVDTRLPVVKAAALMTLCACQALPLYNFLSISNYAS